jgi:hypothetical protein
LLAEARMRAGLTQGTLAKIGSGARPIGLAERVNSGLLDDLDRGAILLEQLLALRRFRQAQESLLHHVQFHKGLIEMINSLLQQFALGAHMWAYPAT